MPKRTDIKTILLIGSGPIVIGQACEFDYSGTQACKALKEEGYRVVLINSNPATIMTDPGLVDATYIEPITVQALEAVIIQEKPDVLLPTMGGQTALNMAIKLHEAGILKKYNVELIGASIEAINKAENRELFAKAMKKLGIHMPRSRVVHSLKEAKDVANDLSFPIIIRPSFTMGGAGGGIARDLKELEAIVSHGLAESPSNEVLVEQSIMGWKEYELEVMRDKKDNVVIICSIENLDPMGVHTGDSITIAPAQTLTDVEYQNLRDMSLAIIREIGVDTGGSNIQFAVNPENGDIMVIEMNPRVSRSSALASKATGFPIAKFAAKLAVGYTLDEIPNDITRKTPASFEPSIDYVVTKIPRFTFEKFPLVEDRLGTQMKSVGEAMAIGRTFRESFQKALRSLETGNTGLDEMTYKNMTEEQIQEKLHKELSAVSSKRIWFVGDAMRHGWDNQKVFDYTKIDPWFLGQIRAIIDTEADIRQHTFDNISPIEMRYWKQMGFSDARMAKLLKIKESQVTQKRKNWNITPVFKLVDTCAAEFPSETPYFYSTYEDENESVPTETPKVMILGSGPNRIGQGIEFDYCCVHAALAIREQGYESIMVNCNPETVSTDYDISDRLYFEPVTFEDVMHIIETERPIGVIVQLGGQTPLKLAKQLHDAGVTIMGTPFESIDKAEDRELFAEVLNSLKLKQPDNGMARSLPEAHKVAKRIGYPVLVRPSYVLGGRAMMIVYSENEMDEFFEEAAKVSPDHPVLIDKFLMNAVELDVDLLCDGENVEIAGIMEHIERAGIHSGDSACCLPPHKLTSDMIQKIKDQGVLMAKKLEVKGLMNVQFAIQDHEIYVLEVNPRASRTVPFVSKAIGHPIAKYATRLMLGETLEEIGFHYTTPTNFSVKETVFPFARFAGADTELGPEMKSTGEVMGRGKTFEEAYIKAQAAIYPKFLNKGYVFIGVRDLDKAAMIPLAKTLESLGFSILATPSTLKVLKDAGVVKLQETHLDYTRAESVYEYMDRNEVILLINTTQRSKSLIDPRHIRRMILHYNLPYCTTVEAAEHYVDALAKVRTPASFTYQPLEFTKKE
ncbi:MAG: carbamoyl-phosphate synthase large subunit [SAR324 cluster bacterium]|nr:carbamoyl-phosphate synthase large subunit [SAR324 cluster bacterium]